MASAGTIIGLIGKRFMVNILEIGNNWPIRPSNLMCQIKLLNNKRKEETNTIHIMADRELDQWHHHLFAAQSANTPRHHDHCRPTGQSPVPDAPSGPCEPATGRSSNNRSPGCFHDSQSPSDHNRESCHRHTPPRHHWPPEPQAHHRQQDNQYRPDIPLRTRLL